MPRNERREERLRGAPMENPGAPVMPGSKRPYYWSWYGIVFEERGCTEDGQTKITPH